MHTGELEMGSNENKQHVVSIPYENIEQPNESVNVQAKSSTVCKLVKGWSDFCGRHYWVMLTLSVVAVLWDPLFFYIPEVDKQQNCLKSDNNLKIIVIVFRTFVDILHTIPWWYRSLHPDRGWYGYREPRTILRWHHYLSSAPMARTIAILAILPLPQAFILAELRLRAGWVKYTVLTQFIVRLYRIMPAYKDATRGSLVLPYTWFAAAFNLVMYIVATNVLGAYWYLRAVEEKIDYWKEVYGCRNETALYCGKWHNCSGSDIQGYGYGIYDDAVEKVIVAQFPYKFFHCFWWALQNLSSLGEGLQPGTKIRDIFFAITITICGVILLVFLIGNMQTYLQSKTPAKLAKMRQRNTYLQGWEPFRLLPENLKREVIRCEEPRWQETTEVNLVSLLNNIPQALQEKLRPHLCKDLFSKIPEFENLRDRPREQLCTLAKPVVFPERSYIFREGDPIQEVVFIVDGNLLSYRNHSTESGILAKHLSAGCFFGEELLRQLIQVAQQQKTRDESSLHLPIAKETIQTVTKVEAFVLHAEDLKEVYTSHGGFVYKPDTNV